MTSDARRDAAAREAWRLMAELVLDNQRRREVSEEAGLSFGKLRALRRIADEPRTMGELAGLLGVDPANLTAVVDDLERAGLAERLAHPSDRRAKVVVATASGAALARAAERRMARPPAGVADLTLEDLEELRRILGIARARKPSGPRGGGDQ